MQEQPQGFRASEQEHLSSQELQRRRDALELSADEIQQELTRQQDYGDRVRGALGTMESSGDVTADNLARIRVLRAELGITDQHISTMNGKLAVLEQEMTQLDALLARTQQREFDVYQAEAPIYQTSPTEWNRVIARTSRVINAYGNILDWIKEHPEDAEAASLLASIRDSVKLYGENIPENPQRQQFRRNPENERRLGILLSMLTCVEPLLPELEKRSVLIDGIRKTGERSLLVPRDTTVTLDIRRNDTNRGHVITLSPATGATYTSGTQDLAIQRTENGWAVTMKPDFVGSVYVNRGNSAEGWNRFEFGLTPAATPRQAAQPTTPQTRTQEPRITETPRRTVEPRGVITPPPVQTEERPQVTPPMQSEQPRATLETAPQQPNVITLPDGRTLPKLRSRSRNRVTPETSTPEPTRQESATPRTQPRPTPNVPPVTPQRTEPLQTPETNDTVTEQRTILVPANRTVYVREAGSRQFHYLQPNFGKNVNWTLGLYAVARKSADGMQWTISKANNFRGNLEISFDCKTWSSPSAAPQTTPTAPQQRPAVTPRTEAPTPPRETAPPAPTTEQSATREAQPTENRRPSENIRTDELHKRFFETMERYKNTIAKDFTTHGGSTEWKVFDHRFNQLQYDIEDGFDGNSPLYVDQREWTRFLSREDRVKMNAALSSMTALLNEYDAATIPKQAPTPVQHIDTLHGDPAQLMRDIADLRLRIEREQTPALKKRFAALDAVYTEAALKARTPTTKTAVLVCQKTMAENFVAARPSATQTPSIFTSLMSRAGFLTAGTDEVSFRRQLLSQAEDTPMDMQLNADQVLQLVLLKQGMDLVRADTSLSPRERYDAVIKVIGENADVLRFLSKESEKKLAATKMLGWEVSTGMKDVFNPETIDWLLAAHIAAEPLHGLSDHSFFYVTPVEGEAPPAAVKKDETLPTEPAAAQTPRITPDSIYDFSSWFGDTEAPPAEKEVEGRTLSADDVLQQGFPVMPGEKVKEIADGSYIACTEHTCRPIRPASQPKPETKEQPAATPAVAEPETPREPTVPEGITVNRETREFRLPANESFLVTYDPPVSGATRAEFGPNLNTNFDGIVLKAECGPSEWVVRVRPTYAGTVTLTRTRDNAIVSLPASPSASPSPLRSRSLAQEAASPKPMSAPLEQATAVKPEELMNEDDFNERVLKSPVPVIVDLYATWCGPCKQMTPHLEAIARRYGNRVRVVKVDGEKFPALLQRYGPRNPTNGQQSYPSIVVFNRGSVHTSTVGYQSERSLENMLPNMQRIAQQR